MTKSAIDRPHLSASQLDSYCRCPEAYRRRYLEGDKIPPAIAMLRGTATHKAAAENFKQKIETREDLPASDFVDIAVSSFDGELSRGFSLDPDEESVGPEKVTGDARDEVADLAKFHIRHQAPDYQPVLVEERIRLALPGSRDLLGVIDLADDQCRVVDFKTSSKRKSQPEVDSSPQLTVYAAAYHAHQGHAPQSVSLDVTVSGAKGVTRQVLSSTRGAEDFAVLARRIDVISKSIDAGSFPPATPGAWWCSPKMCGYWRTCPYVNSERATLAQE